MAPPLLPLAITLGEPAGIGPDTIVEAWTRLRGDPRHGFLVIGDAGLLEARARALEVEIPIRKVGGAADAGSSADALPVLHSPLPSTPSAGHPDPRNSKTIIGYIDRAATLALAGEVAGLVTGPIQKETLYSAGFAHQGHTDYLAHLARQAGHRCEPVMMLSAGRLRTVPVTVHIPLKDVPGALSSDLIVRQALVCASGITPLLRRPPRLVVTGLNPHAGEGGTIGGEDRDVIAPAVRTLKEKGLDVVGPVAADSIFHAEARARFDVAICMYHDQALIPVKTLGFHHGVNTTLGLPFVRTSPDHGTALSLAGTGRADPRSMIAAIRMARRLASARRK